MEPKYRAFYCSSCDMTHIYRTSVVPGCEAYERARCPGCDRPLEPIRADTDVELVMSRPGDIREAAERSIRQLEESTYPETADVPVDTSGDVLES